MRKFIMGLLGMCLASMLIVASQTSASASTYKQTHDDRESAFMEVGYGRQSDGAGFTIYYITIWCDPDHWGALAFGWEDIALDGHGLSIRNLDTNNIRWSRDDSDSNVHLDSGGQYECKRTWSVNQTFPDANSMAIYYSFTGQRKLQPDYDDSMRIVINN